MSFFIFGTNGDTIFDIASIAKTFVTIILVDMVKQGLVSLDDPIEKYLPQHSIKQNLVFYLHCFYR